jgi:flagellar protein FlgJ
MMRFIFGEGTDTPDAQTLAQRREIVNQLARRSLSGTPRNLGEGLSAIGEALAYRFQDGRLSDLEGEERQRIAEMLSGMGMGGGMGAMPGAGSGIVAPGGGAGPSAGAGGRSTAAVANAVTGTGAPTTGAIPRLPATSTMEGDPRRGMFPTGQELIDDPNVFTTRITGATAGVSPELLNIIGNSTEQMVGPGAEVMVTSGLRPGSVGSQHSAGQAADFGVRMPGRDAEGRLVLPGMDAASGRERLNYSSPEIFDIARAAVSDGASGIGIGPTYMGGDVFHFDTGRGGGSAPNFGETVRTWSDWNRTGPRGASDPMGAGDPRFGFREELQGIRNAREMPVGGALTASAGTPSPQPVSAPSGAMPAPQMPQISLQDFAEIMGNPYATPGQRAVAQALMTQQMQAMDPMRQMEMERLRLQLDAMRNPQADPFAGTQVINGQLVTMQNGQPVVLGDFNQPDPGFQMVPPNEVAQLGLPPGAYQRGADGRITQVGGGGTNVSVENVIPGQDRFDDAFAVQDAQALNAISTAGLAAQRNIARIDELGGLLDASPSGFGAALRARAGEYGINTEGLSDLQAAQAIINSLVPEQRQPGSGPMSDADLELFKQSLPRLINTPEGNRQIISTMRGIAEYDAEGARIVQRLRGGEMTRAQAFEALQARPNPLGGMFGAGASGQQPSAAPAQGQAPTVAQIRSLDARDLIRLDTSQLGAAEMRALQERLEELSRE